MGWRSRVLWVEYSRMPALCSRIVLSKAPFSNTSYQSWPIWVRTL